MAFGRNRTWMGRGKQQPAAPRVAREAQADHWLQPLPEPDVVEGGDSVWEAWQRESQRMDLAFAETQPSDLIPLTGAPHAPVEPERRRGALWTADDVTVVARRNSRVCPRPFLWSALYALLEGDRYADLRPPPVQAWEWAALSNLQRRQHFRDHIQWADRHGKLEAMGRFIESLSEPDWIHMGDD